MISVVVPVYNAEIFLKNTLNSILNQSYQDIEIVVVDDKSTDHSLDIIHEYMQLHPNMKLVRHDVNQGIAQARNTGILNAAGEYIALIDSDDLWMKNKLEMQLSFMREHNALFSYTGYECIYENGGRNSKIFHVPRKVDYKRLLWNNVIGTSTVMILRQLMLLHLMPPVKYEDYACWLDILRDGNMAYGLDVILCSYCKHSNSDSSSKFRALKWNWNVLRKMEKLPLLKAYVYTCNYIVKGIIKHFVPIRSFKL